mgnify:FL=1
MALDEIMEKILLKRNQEARQPVHELSPTQAREQERLEGSTHKAPDKYTVTDRLVPGLQGNLTARIYTPKGDGPFPILIWLHGGGWVTGDLDLSQTTPINLCTQANYVVASVGYRLAPETKFPGPVEDCYAAAAWIRDNAINLNGIPGKVCIGGSSAGGNLAAAVCLMTRDRGAQQFLFQLLIYPVTSSTTETESYQLYSSGYGLEKESMDWFIRQYLNDEQDLLNPYAMPLNATNLEGLCAAMIITAECDPLRDEGEAYAHRLRRANIPTDYACYSGMVHGFFSMTDILPQSRDAVAAVVTKLTALAKET